MQHSDSTHQQVVPGALLRLELPVFGCERSVRKAEASRLQSHLSRQKEQRDSSDASICGAFTGPQDTNVHI